MVQSQRRGLDLVVLRDRGGDSVEGRGTSFSPAWFRVMLSPAPAATTAMLSCPVSASFVMSVTMSMV
jgi:hypothetical protein